LDLVDEMHAEWKYRYNHPDSKQHKSYSVAQYLRENIPAPDKFEKEKRPHKMTPFALAMPDEYKVGDIIESYRNYYNGSKSDFAVWKNRETPEWFRKKVNS
jgi:hypothetical protein